MILEKVEQFEPWKSLMHKQSKTEAERLLIQAVAMLSTEPAYSDKTPDEVYELVCTQAQELYR